jgi:hypothetical protein
MLVELDVRVGSPRPPPRADLVNDVQSLNDREKRALAKGQSHADLAFGSSKLVHATDTRIR